MVWKLLRKNISPAQIIGYSVASLIGLTIVISAVKLYCDVRTVLNGDDSLIGNDYIIISKPVSTASLLGGKSSVSFSDNEIKELERQPWVSEVGKFTAADFHVNAAIDFGGKGMSSQLFFEAIPDAFLDIEPQQWAFTPPADPEVATPQQIDRIEIPVIISRDYLALYNFGFAAARGLPQLNEKLIQSVPLTFYLSGNGHGDTYHGRIVGFSSRLNTVAVPLDFMQWANRRYAPELSDKEPSRLIVRTNTTGDPGIKKFIESHSYEVAADKADNSRANYFLRIATTIVIAVGAIITALAMFILMLSIILLLQKNRQKLHDLMLLGYEPRQIARPYYLMVLIINLNVLILSLIAMLIASRCWIDKLSAIDITATSPVPAIIVGLCITAVLTLVNCILTRHIVRKNFFS